MFFIITWQKVVLVPCGYFLSSLIQYLFDTFYRISLTDNWQSPAYIDRHVLSPNVVSSNLYVKSLWKIFHKRGPNDYPCGQPLVIFFQVLTAESSLTRFNPLAKYDIINWSDSVETSHSLRLFIMSGGFKESNALLMSVERTPVYRFSSTFSFQSSLSFITVFLQLWFLTKKLQVL